MLKLGAVLGMFDGAVEGSLKIGILDVGLVYLILLLDAVPLDMEDEGSEHPIQRDKGQGECKPSYE